MFLEAKTLIFKVVSLAIVAPLLASSLLYIVGKIEEAWKLGSYKKNGLRLQC